MSAPVGSGFLPDEDVSQSGVVKCFFPQRKFGFIIAKDGKEYFFHASRVRFAYREKLPLAGDEVCFLLSEGKDERPYVETWWYASAPPLPVSEPVPHTTVDQAFLDRFPFLAHLLATDALGLLPKKYPVEVHPLSSLDRLSEESLRISFFPGDCVYDVLIAVRRNGAIVLIKASIKMGDGYEVRAPTIGEQLKEIRDLSAVVYANAFNCLLMPEERGRFTGPLPPIVIFTSSEV